MKIKKTNVSKPLPESFFYSINDVIFRDCMIYNIGKEPPFPPPQKDLDNVFHALGTSCDHDWREHGV